MDASSCECFIVDYLILFHSFLKNAEFCSEGSKLLAIEFDPSQGLLLVLENVVHGVAKAGHSLATTECGEVYSALDFI